MTVNSPIVREIALELRAHPGAAAMQEHPLVALREIERLADLICRAALDVAQRDHDALRGRKLLDRAKNYLPDLTREEPLLRRLPTSRSDGPVPGIGLVIRGKKPIGIHGRVVFVTDQRRERRVAVFTRRPGLRGVAQDSEDPGAQRGAALEAVHAFQDTYPCLLQNLLGGGPGAHIAHRYAKQRGAVVVDQPTEGILVPISQRLDQRGLVHLAEG